MPQTTCALKSDRLSRDRLQLAFEGDWIVGAPVPSADFLLDLLRKDAGLRAVHFDCGHLARWDSLLLTVLVRIIEVCRDRSITVELEGLPPGVQGLLALAYAVPEHEDVRRTEPATGALAALGRDALNGVEDCRTLLEFLGETTLAFGRLLKGRAFWRRPDLWRLIHDAGPGAVPIVSLISILVGMILAFVGAVQLRMFGAQLFIADLVGLGMAREMGAMMTAIIMAGRTGAAYAAQIGSMQANDEIDALTTSGFSPMEFLVLPRILALASTMPFLCLYADAMGILGGALVSAGLFDISLGEYLLQVKHRLHLQDFASGVAKCAVFGVLVAVAGCMRGLGCGRSSTAVGLATTSAVVTGIVFIVVADAVMNFVINTLRY